MDRAAASALATPEHSFSDAEPVTAGVGVPPGTGTKPSAQLKQRLPYDRQMGPVPRPSPPGHDCGLTSAQVPGVLAADAAPARRQRGQLQLAQLRAQQLDARDQARRQLLVPPGARHPQPPQPRRQP